MLHRFRRRRRLRLRACAVSHISRDTGDEVFFFCCTLAPPRRSSPLATAPQQSAVAAPFGGRLVATCTRMLRRARAPLGLRLERKLGGSSSRRRRRPRMSVAARTSDYASMHPTSARTPPPASLRRPTSRRRSPGCRSALRPSLAPSEDVGKCSPTRPPMASSPEDLNLVVGVPSRTASTTSARSLSGDLAEAVTVDAHLAFRPEHLPGFTDFFKSLSAAANRLKLIAGLRALDTAKDVVARRMFARRVLPGVCASPARARCSGLREAADLEFDPKRAWISGARTASAFM